MMINETLSQNNVLSLSHNTTLECTLDDCIHVYNKSTCIQLRGGRYE